MKTGAFIVIDGPNGTGKTSALKSAAIRLRTDGYTVIETREPGGTPLAEELRALILSSNNDMDTTTQLMLLNAARRSHIQEVIVPKVAEGAIVLCDRFLASSLVFQSLNSDGSRNLDDEVILQAHAMFCFNLKPHLSLYLDAPTHVRLSRIDQRLGSQADRFEEYGSAFEAATSEKFRACGAIIDDDFASIDADRAPADVASSVYDAIAQKLAAMDLNPETVA